MGSLHLQIAKGIQMSKPRSFKEATNLARMRDDQLSRHQEFINHGAPTMNANQSGLVPSARKTNSTPMKRLTKDEMKIR